MLVEVEDLRVTLRKSKINILDGCVLSHQCDAQRFTC
jgi:hypothetical protein